MASDGVWEFLTNKQVLDITAKFYFKNDPKGAAEKLVEESRKCWRKVNNIYKITNIYYRKIKLWMI